MRLRPAVVERFMRAWAMRKVARLRPHLRGSSVLDVGAGDGWIAERLSRAEGMDVTLLDVVDMNRTDLPLVWYDGERMPFDDRSFDTVLAMTVLHHCDEPEAVLDECIRVCDRRLIVTESVYHTRPGRWALTWMDRAFNGVRSGGRMNGPLRFRRADAWREAFAQRGLRVVSEQWLSRGVHQHVLFALERAE